MEGEDKNLAEPLVPVPVPNDPTSSDPVTFQELNAGDASDDDDESNEDGEEGEEGGTTRGEKQGGGCRDIPFAILFWAQLIAMVVCASIYGPAAFEEFTIDNGKKATKPITVNATAYMDVAVYTGVIAIILAGCMFFILTCCGEILIKLALLIQVAMSLLFTIAAFSAGNIWGGIFGIIFFLLGVCYARIVWSRIPFATANLVTSLTAVKSNCGVTIVAYIFGLLSVAWFLLWSLVVVGIAVHEACDMNTHVCNTNAASKLNAGYMFLLFLSFFFTTQVIQNSVHTTVAGVVGTWWFVPEEGSSCCSSAVLGSTFRTLTTSFGSICFGSLLVAIIQALRQLAYSMRQEGGNAILLCIADCILGCIESVLEYFNKWAYIYVGLYGYPYLQAGKAVFTLFKDRGWDAIIADDLVSNVLFLLSLVTGLITGGVGVAFLKTTDLFGLPDTNANVGTAFGFGFIIGLMLTSTLMSVVGSGVNAVIVCFAEGPAEFQENHPELSERMVSTWRGAYPDCI